MTKISPRPFWVFFLSVIGLLSAGVQAGSLPDFTKLVEEHSPAVVNISTVSHSKRSPYNRGLRPEELEQLPEFFRHFFGAPYGPGSGQESRETQSMGSGFIVSEDGFVLTNNHVIDGADEIIVRLSDRRELPAKLIGADARSDLAVLKIDAEDLPVVKVGKSEKLKTGEWVLAIGSPFGFDYTVTAGIVSAIGRTLPNENYVPFIQTDVAINPGNSGGPLFNLDGEVVGINSQIYTRSGGFMGVSFAIPIDVAMEVVDQLQKKGYVARGWLGVLIQEVSKDLAESFGLKKPHGALVAQVVPGSPAEAAGLMQGDVIIKYDGEVINRSSDLPHLVGRAVVGKKSKLDIIRAGKRQTITVEIGELPTEQGAVIPAKGSKVESNRFNIEVAELDENARKRLQVSNGLMVTQVGQGAARNAGIRANDVISSINNQEIKSLTDFNAVVKSLPSNRAIPVLIIRQGNPSFVVIKLKE
ncbi:DegQ family serine endoprotease [Alkalimarinus alittae]|uniref:Probable periplasmic serine endoprotease DegP-like n=1 Tax=Alkalimarinus alittae TaxID=2961619 RepID=A0ABY6MZF4_9ALTE|nr:DegQ family serine endoprotease [Alkalimarinus alittae]UZE95231.1 DegQ family serine endoprotease [Alkalimarinus alittae]